MKELALFIPILTGDTINISPTIALMVTIVAFTSLVFRLS